MANITICQLVGENYLVKYFIIHNLLTTFAARFEQLGDFYYPAVLQVVLKMLNQSETTGYRARADTMNIK